MKLSSLYLTVAVGFFSFCSVPARAQTTAPGTATNTRPNFSGRWSLDPALSSDPSKAAFDGTPDRGRSRTGGRRGGGFGGFGGSSGGNTGGAMTSDERTRLQELTNQIKRSFAQLTISHSELTLAITDPQDHTQLFQTDGIKDQHQLTSITAESTTHWDDTHLVTEYALSSSRKLVYTYTLVPRTDQMVIRIRLDATSRSRAAPQEVMLVYSRAPER
jgi:hypothetical protein